MRTRQQREAQRVGVLLDHCFHDLFGRLMQSGVDDLETRVAQGARDDLGAAVVAVQTGLGDHNTVGTLHDSHLR